MKDVTRLALGVVVVLMSCGLAVGQSGGGAPGGPTAIGNPLSHPIIFVSQVVSDAGEMQISDVHGNFQGDNPERDQPIGGNLYRLDPGQSVPINLTQRFDAAVRNPEISWDGQRVLFSMKIGALGKWQIYEIGVDGTGLQRLTQTDHNETEAVYMPDGRIAFVSDRLRLLDPYENFPTGQIHVMDANGTNVRRLSEDPGGETNLTISESGTIAFSRWHATIDDPCRIQSFPNPFLDHDISRFALWDIRPDGDSDAHSLYGMHLIDDFQGGIVQARPLYDGTGRYVANIATAEAYGAGGLAIIDPADEVASNGAPTPQWITDPTDYLTFTPPASGGRYRDPYPVGPDSYLVSFAAGDIINKSFAPELTDVDPNFGLYLLSQNTRTVIFDDPDRWEFEPVLAAPRTPPPVLPPTLPLGQTTGILNCMDVMLRAQMPPGTVNRPDQENLDTNDAAFVYIFKGVPSQIVYPGFPGYRQIQPALIGRAPVQSDGSFAARVPAGEALLWKVFDAQGNVLVEERFWNSVRPGQIQTCAGCHQPKDGTVGRTSNAALATPTDLAAFDATRMIPGIPAASASRLEWTTDQPRELDARGVPVPQLFGVDGEELSDNDAIPGQVTFRVGVSINVDDPRLFGPFSSTNTDVAFLELVSPSLLNPSSAQEQAEAQALANALASLGPTVVEGSVVIQSGAPVAAQATSALVDFVVPNGSERTIVLYAIDQQGDVTVAILDLEAEAQTPPPTVGHEREDPSYNTDAVFTTQGGCEPPDPSIPLVLAQPPETVVAPIGQAFDLDTASGAALPGATQLEGGAWARGPRIDLTVRSAPAHAAGSLWASLVPNAPVNVAGFDLWADLATLVPVRTFRTDDQGIWRGGWVVPYENALAFPISWFAVIENGPRLDVTHALWMLPVP